MMHRPATRDRCCTPWNWLVRLIFAFLLAASLLPRVRAHTAYDGLSAAHERAVVAAGSDVDAPPRFRALAGHPS